MKKTILLFIILIKITGCMIPEIQINNRPKPWPGEVFYYYSDEMYDHPNIIKNIEHFFTDVESKIDIIFYESSELNSDTVLLTYEKGINSSTVGMVDEPIVTISSYTLYITYNLMFSLLGVPYECDNTVNWPSDFDWQRLKNVYGE